jgi:PAS domain S-box-containing protein
MTTHSPALDFIPFPPQRVGWRTRIQCVGTLLIVTVALADSFRRQLFPFDWIEFGGLPMSWTAEWLFVVLGIALGLHLFPSAWRLGHRIGMVLSLFAAAITLHVIACRLFGAVPRWEIWLDSPEARAAGLMSGRLTIQTAALFLVSNFALLALLSPLARRTGVHHAGIFAALAVEIFSLVTVVSYAAGNPPFTNSAWLQVSPIAMAEFATFNFVLLTSAAATNRLRHWFFGVDVAAEPADQPLPSDERRVIALLAASGLLALGASVAYLRVQTNRQQLQTLEAMQTLSDLKARQVVTWRRDRIAEARAMAKLPLLLDAVAGAVDAKGIAAARAGLEPWLAALRANNLYSSAVVLDRNLQPIAAEPRRTPIAPGPAGRLAALPAATDIIEVPPYVDATGTLHWDLLVPLRTGPGADWRGAIWLQTAPGRHIISQLEWWPDNYRTGQTVLWFRDGDRLTSLGGLKESSTVTARQTRPFAETRTLSQLPDYSLLVRAVRGEIATGEGWDHHGRPIFGTTNSIRNSSWFLTSRVDSSEVYATLRRDAWLVAGLLLGLLGTTGTATSWLWRQRQRNLVHERLAAELEQKRATARLDLVMRHAHDIIFVTDEKMRFLDANQKALDTYGWSKEELLQMTIPELGAPVAGGSLPWVIEGAGPADGAIFETIHVRKDGTSFPVEISLRRVEIEGRPQLLSIIRDISERKRAEAELRGSEEKFSKAFQANPSGIAISELATGQFIEVNESWCRIMGYSAREAIGQTAEELGVWGRAAESDQLARSLLDGKPFRNFELLSRARGGEEKIVLVNAELIALNGQHCGLFMIEDITDRKRAEAALRASEERYRLIADNTSDVIWLYDLVADRFTYASPSALPLLGYQPEEVVGRRLLDFVAPASQGAARRALEPALRSAPGARAPMRVVAELEQQRKDGSLVPTEVVTSVLSDSSGRVTHLLGVTRDITEREKARAALEKFNTDLEQQVALRTAELAARNREIEALVDSIPDTVLLCDAQGELVTSHFARTRGSAFPFARPVSGDPLSQHHPVLLDIARELHAVAWACQEAIMQEFDRQIDGVNYSIEARATPAGEDRLLILFRDISARKRIERAAQANLERERQLSEMKTQFISVASHEFRTPLAAATGSLELLERHAARITEAKRLELLTRAQRSLGRLTTIMDNVLRLSRADSGRGKVKRMNIDLIQFVQDLIREVEMGDRQQHAFTFQASGGGAPVPIDTNLLNHVLSNLLGNAVRYSPAGTRISVALEIGDAAFSLTVADEGIGIPPAERERIFEPFARGSNVGQIGGTGLGLNIVKRYTELMGGQIELLPADRGAVFRVAVPFHQSTPSA